MIGKLYKSILKNGKKIGIYPFLIGSSIIISSTLIGHHVGNTIKHLLKGNTINFSILIYMKNE